MRAGVVVNACVALRGEGRRWLPVFGGPGLSSGLDEFRLMGGEIAGAPDPQLQQADEILGPKDGASRFEMFKHGARIRVASGPRANEDELRDFVRVAQRERLGIAPPIEMPLTMARAMPSRSSNAATSSAICSVVYGPAGFSDFPTPRLSTRMQVK